MIGLNIDYESYHIFIASLSVIVITACLTIIIIVGLVMYIETDYWRWNSCVLGMLLLFLFSAICLGRHNDNRLLDFFEKEEYIKNVLVSIIYIECIIGNVLMMECPLFVIQ